jgi:hypothetical protein
LALGFRAATSLMSLVIAEESVRSLWPSSSTNSVKSSSERALGPSAVSALHSQQRTAHGQRFAPAGQRDKERRATYLPASLVIMLLNISYDKITTTPFPLPPLAHACRRLCRLSALMDASCASTCRPSLGATQRLNSFSQCRTTVAGHSTSARIAPEADSPPSEAARCFSITMKATVLRHTSVGVRATRAEPRDYLLHRT